MKKSEETAKIRKNRLQDERHWETSHIIAGNSSGPHAIQAKRNRTE